VNVKCQYQCQCSISIMMPDDAIKITTAHRPTQAINYRITIDHASLPATTITITITIMRTTEIELIKLVPTSFYSPLQFYFFLLLHVLLGFLSHLSYVYCTRNVTHSIVTKRNGTTLLL
jgi:hypothetical protein